MLGVRFFVARKVDLINIAHPVPGKQRSPSAMSRHSSSAKRTAGFTLTEVMITMLLISMMCIGVFAGLRQISKAMLAVAVRSEAHRVLQAEAERLLSTDFTSFTASAPETITSSVKPSYVPSKASAFTLPPGNAAGRVKFTREVIAVASSDTSRTLRVEVRWTWQNQPNVVSSPLFRTR